MATGDFARGTLRGLAQVLNSTMRAKVALSQATDARQRRAAEDHFRQQEFDLRQELGQRGVTLQETLGQQQYRINKMALAQKEAELVAKERMHSGTLDTTKEVAGTRAEAQTTAAQIQGNTTLDAIAAEGAQNLALQTNAQDFQRGENQRNRAATEDLAFMQIRGQRELQDFQRGENQLNRAATEDLAFMQIRGQRELQELLVKTQADAQRDVALIEKGLSAGGVPTAPGAENRLTAPQMASLLKYSSALIKDPDYREMFEIRAGNITAMVGAQQNNGFGDIAMVNGYQRMIDPGATVRSEDVATLESAVSALQRVVNIPGLVIEGDRLSPASRAMLERAISDQYNARLANFETFTKGRFQQLLERDPLLGGGAVSFGDIGVDFSIAPTQVAGGARATAPSTLDASLVDFVARARALRSNDGAIRQTLVNKGVDPAIIEQLLGGQ